MFVSSPEGSEVANTISSSVTSYDVAHAKLESLNQSATHLDKLVPAGGDNDWVLWVRAEAHARDPLGVALLGNGVLAVAEGVPQLDSSVARAGDDLSVVRGEGDGEDVVGVANEAAGGRAGRELPQAEGLVPGRGESVCAVRGDDLCLRISTSCLFIQLL